MSFRSYIRNRVASWRRPVFEFLGSDRYSRLALNDLDRKLQLHLDFRDGFFIEAGANDGLAQSNTYWFERFRDWRGILIEAVPEQAQACRQNRPKAITVQSALVGSQEVRSVEINAANLMACVVGSFDSETEATHLANAMEVQQLAYVEKIEVPARTLTEILDENGSPQVDLFSLDVEGFEVEVLKGLDLNRYRPTNILVETRKLEAVLDMLGRYYQPIAQLSHHDHLLRLK